MSAAVTPSRRACLFGAIAPAAATVAVGTAAASGTPSAVSPGIAAAAAQDAGGGADAELLELCADWLANDAEFVRLSELDFAMEEKAAADGVRPSQRDRIDFSGNVDQGHELLEEITATPARTAAGRRGKAAVLAARVAPGGEDPSSYQHDECLALSLARDVLAMGEEAA